jgi:chromosome segregation ATPase
MFFSRALDEVKNSGYEQELTTVNCPKCGYVQEERLDCRKCGVVFSKYYALHSQDTPPHADSREASSPPPHTSTESYLPDLVEMRQSLKDIGRRLNETDFERAERNRLSGEVRALDQRIQELQAQLAASVEGLEKRTSNLVSSLLPSEEHLKRLNLDLIEAYLVPLLTRLDQVEEKAGLRLKDSSLENEAHLQNILREVERRLEALEEQKSKAKDELAGKPVAESIFDPEKILKEVEELRMSLHNVTVRYSEIGELKKNHLVLMSQMESIRQEMDSSKKESAAALSSKIPELEMEVHALRAEVRQAINRLETIESYPLSSAQDLQSLRNEVETLKETHANELAKTQAAIAGLEAVLTERLSSVTGLPEDLKWVNQRCQFLEENLARVCQDLNGAFKKTADLDDGITSILGESQQVRGELQALGEKLEQVMSQPPPEPRPPMEEDVHAIRNDLRRVLEMVVKPGA